jgi:hypothetical protein
VSNVKGGYWDSDTLRNRKPHHAGSNPALQTLKKGENQMYKFIILSILFLTVSACGMKVKPIPTTAAEVNNMIGTSQPIEYRQGFRDGFDSGEVAKGNQFSEYAKDIVRYGSDTIYKQGWDDGFAFTTAAPARQRIVIRTRR